MCISPSAAPFPLVRGCSARFRRGGLVFLEICILGRDKEESLELQREEALVRVGEDEDSSSEGDGSAGEGRDWRLDEDRRAASSTTDL